MAEDAGIKAAPAEQLQLLLKELRVEAQIPSTPPPRRSIAAGRRCGASSAGSARSAPSTSVHLRAAGRAAN